ncbi:hypothetical protein AMJ57_03615 [Parcubacteria bacterium SG8_24]|nr:MAG: hypothetical protein AMJ57_03615 [Parcubacteria bacterium SG8_24]
MKRLGYLLLIIVFAVLGFILGRSTGDILPGSSGHDGSDYPLPPPPPEEDIDVGEDGTDEAVSVGVIVEEPAENAVLYGAFRVSGRVLLPAAAVEAVLVSPDGEEIASQEGQVEADTGETYGRFDLVMTPPDQAGGKLTLQVNKADDEGDDPDMVARRHVILVKPDSVDVEVFFQNSELDPMVECDRVFSVKRQVSSQGSIYRAVLESLLQGPSDDEREEGYSSSLPSGVRLKSVAADAEGRVTADFSSRLDRGVGGSCRVTAIRAQIVATLEQFPEVNEVIIAVEGEVEEALQP